MKVYGEEVNRLRMMTAPPGWRARVGIIMPSIDPGITVHEYEMIFPEGVVPLVTRMMLRKSTVEELTRMQKDAEYAAELLSTANPTCVSYTCTAGAFILGVEHDREIIAKLRRITGVPATTMANAVIEALRAVGAKNILLVCPYTEDIVAAELKYMEEQGFNIVDHKGLGISDTKDIFDITPWETYELAITSFKKLVPGSVDAIQISCGAFRAVEIIDYLEKATGIPCVSSNQANAWHCLKLAGIHEPVHGFGKLLEGER